MGQLASSACIAHIQMIKECVYICMRGKNMEKETKKEKKNPHQESKKSYYTFLSGFPIVGKDTLVCEQLFKLMKD